MKRLITLAGALAALVFLAACSGAPDASKKAPGAGAQPTSTGPGPATKLPGAVKPTLYTHKVVNIFPHEPGTFTQGLLYWNGFLYESTGQYGDSSVRKTKIDTGEILQVRDIEPEYFGEGITRWNDKLIMLTWKASLGFIFDLETFEGSDTFSYPGQGWGLTNNDTHFIQSDGTNVLRFLDTATFKVAKTLKVRMNGRPLQKLNELEWIDGEIWSNVWQSDIVVRIDPDSGNVVGVIDLANLYPQSSRQRPNDDVMNGIAYNPETKSLFVTGKNWPSMFEIEISEFGPPG